MYRYMVTIDVADGPGFTYGSNARTKARAFQDAQRAWWASIGSTGRKATRVDVRDLFSETFDSFAKAALAHYRWQKTFARGL